MRSLKFDADAWEDYLYWQATDKAIPRRVNGLIKEIARDPFVGTGKPEPLKHELAGWWSRRITDEHRIVYRVLGNVIEIAQIRYHY
jgi:toxin YoeB